MCWWLVTVGGTKETDFIHSQKTHIQLETISFVIPTTTTRWRQRSRKEGAEASDKAPMSLGWITLVV